jgi:hypothetical protein
LTLTKIKKHSNKEEEATVAAAIQFAEESTRQRSDSVKEKAKVLNEQIDEVKFNNFLNYNF